MSKNVKYFQGIPYRVSYRRVKYPRLEFITGVLHLILPYGVKPETILKRKANWIGKKYQIIQKSKVESHKLPISQRSFEEFKRLLNQYLGEAEKILGVQVDQIRIRRMRTKWGSCSKRGTITINRLAQFLPENLLRYLVFHEANHRRFWRHNRDFWNNLRNVFKDVGSYEEKLTLYWFRLSEDTKIGKI